MKIAVMATGGLGGYYGALLSKNGNDVTFIARGAHLRAIRENGLTIQSMHGNFVVKPAQATDNPREIGTVDWVLFAVKTYDTESAAQLIKPMVGAPTTVVTFQNGVDAFDQIGAAVGKARVIVAPTQIESAISAPGVISQNSAFRRSIVGEMNGKISPRVEWLVDQLKRAGVEASASDQMPAPLWLKLMFLASASGLTTLARTEGATLFQSQLGRATLRAAMQEVVDIATAHGVKLPVDALEKQMEFAASWRPGMTTSMHKDLLAGKRLEVDALSGAVVRLGAAKGIATPVHQTIYIALKAEDERAKEKSAKQKA